MSKIDPFKEIPPEKKLVLKCNWRELVAPDFDMMRKTIDEMEDDIKSRGCEGKAHTFFAFRIDEETQKLHVKVMWLEKRDKE